MKREFVPELACLHPYQPETGSFSDQCIIRHPAVRDQKSGTYFLRFNKRPRRLVAWLAAGFCDDRTQQEVSFKPMPRTSDGLGRDKKRCHGTLVVANAFADQQTVFLPRAVVRDGSDRRGPNPSAAARPCPYDC